MVFNRFYFLAHKCSTILSASLPGCKESHFLYSFPFRQAVAKKYWPKSHLTGPENIFDEQDCIDFGSSVI